MKGNKRVTLTTLILAILLVVAGLLAWQVRKELPVVSGLRQDIAKERAAQSEYDSLAVDYEEYRNLEGEWKEFFVDDEAGVARFASSLEQLAVNNGLTLEIGFEDLVGLVEVGGKATKGLKMDLSLRGTYEGIEGFLRGIEGGRYLVKEEKILLSRGGEDLDHGVVVSGFLLMNGEE